MFKFKTGQCDEQSSGLNIDSSRPTFVELLKELSGKSYVSPIQYSLQLTLFNGVIPVLDHHLDLVDFKDLDCSY